jgi:hypothetical protein
VSALMNQRKQLIVKELLCGVIICLLDKRFGSADAGPNNFFGKIEM